MGLDLDNIFSRINLTGLDLYVDVGLSFNAPHSREVLDDEPNTFVIGVEPNPSSRLSIRENYIPESEERFLLVPCGIANVKEVEYREFNCIGPDPGTSSFLEPTKEVQGSRLYAAGWQCNGRKPVGADGSGFYVEEVIDTPVVSLKSVLDRVPWEKFSSKDFRMKSDTQGYECEVLHSLGDYIHNITELQIEISTAPNGVAQYHNAPESEDIFNLIESTSKLQFSTMGGGNAWFIRK